MKNIVLKSLVIVALASFIVYAADEMNDKKPDGWYVHDMNQPKPKVVTPGKTPADPPSDAIVLFDGTDLSAWRGTRNDPQAKWKVENGYMEVTSTGDIMTKEGFGSCQLHIEFATPEEVKGSSQGRGNSGIFLMGRYEVQVLDCYNNETYADGQTGSIYGQRPPLVNPTKAPGQWQVYDIIFNAPKFENGKCVTPANATILLNGVLVQNHWELWGPTMHKRMATYVGQAHGDKEPLKLQDHGNPVRFRNIWIRPLD